MNIFLNNLTNKYSYEEYKNLHEQQIEKNLNGQYDLIKLNLQRIKRIEKQFNPAEKIIQILNELKVEYKWLVISEPWCGDSAQIIPILNKIAELSPKIEMKIILRDENPEIMNKFLTNGGRAIPKLLQIDTSTGRVVNTWGPRPQKIADMVKEFKKTFPEATKEEFHKNLHKWYAIDKGNSVAEDIEEFLKEFNPALN